MSLTLKFKASPQIDATGTKIYLDDATGVFEPTANSGGFGTPNLDRASIAVYPLGYFRPYKGGDSPVEFALSDPLNVNPTNYVAKVTKDGWYLFSQVWAPVVTNPVATDYEEGEVVFDTEEYALVQLKKGKFVLVKPEVLRGTEQEGEVLELLHLAFHAKEQIQLTQQLTDLYIDSENLSNKKKILLVQEQENRLRSILVSSDYQWCIGNKYVAARQIDFLSTNRYVSV